MVQEFFFHLFGAIDLEAQLVNDQKQLGINSEDVYITKVAGRLRPGDPLRAALRALYVATRNKPLALILTLMMDTFLHI